MKSSPQFVCYSPRPDISQLAAEVLAELKRARGVFRQGMTAFTIAALIGREKDTFVDPKAVTEVARELHRAGIVVITEDGKVRLTR